MLTIKVQGGLGNQLFQYFLGIALSKTYGKNVQYDISFYSDNAGHATMRNYALDILNAGDIKTIAQSPISKTLTGKFHRFFNRKFSPYYRHHYITERQANFDPNIFKVSDNTYLDGYWQSYKYFESVAGYIKDNLTLHIPFSKAAQDLKKSIQASSRSVAMHIRRTDYVTKYADIYHAQNVEYYERAVEHIINNENESLVTFYVFSDDLKWCNENLKHLKNLYFVEADIESHEGMLLMALCNHNIIANSTYSWWGAWLNKNENKQVIAPRMWFKDPQKNNTYLSSLYPATWKVL